MSGADAFDLPSPTVKILTYEANIFEASPFLSDLSQRSQISVLPMPLSVRASSVQI